MNEKGSIEAQMCRLREFSSVGITLKRRKIASGRVSLILLVVILVVMGVGGKVLVDFYLQKQKARLADSPRQTEASAMPEAMVESPTAEPPPVELPPLASPIEAPPPAPAVASKPAGIESLDTFIGLKLPLELRVIKSFSLLNPSGKETEIPMGQVITIQKRSKLGTLTIDIKGYVYAGNESRLVHKVESL
jgi:hypothetical protein